MNDDLPRGSRNIIEWVVDWAKEGRLAAKITHLRFGPMGSNLMGLSNERAFGAGFRVGFLVSGLGARASASPEGPGPHF